VRALKTLNLLGRIRNRFYFRYLPKLVDWLVHLSNFEARRLIAKSQAHSILVDNSVLGYGITHETGWVSNGTVIWGDTVPIDTGYAARVPVHNESDQKSVARSVRFLPGIVDLAKSGSITLYRSFELQDETITHPTGRYSGYGLYDLSLFKDVPLTLIPDSSHSLTFGHQAGTGPTVKEQISSRRADILSSDPRAKELEKALGKKNSQDAIHIATAERNGFYCFLTMDFRLIDAINSQSGHPAIKKLKTKILSPEEYSQQFKIKPFHTRLFSFHKASFPVAYSENWANSDRQSKSKR